MFQCEELYECLRMVDGDVIYEGVLFDEEIICEFD